MASERQIAANRRNASKSTGPRTEAGKMRASHNALRHGMASQGLRAREAERIEELARQIAGDSQDPIVLELARCAAAAEFDMVRGRQASAALIARAGSLGTLEAPRYFRTWQDELRWLLAQTYVGELERLGKRPAVPPLPPPEPINPTAPMPTGNLERTSESVRRILPELHRIYRAEQRAAARRDSAIRKIGEYLRDTKRSTRYKLIQ
jgi:hypothetical protein